jgi:uncharacterized protein (DUF433 family)
MWSPLGLHRPVVLDPARSFGLPIVESGVRTDIIAEHHDAGDDVVHIAGWYRIGEGDVEAALEFEGRLRGRAA